MQLTHSNNDVPDALADQSADGDPVLKKYAGAVHIGADLTLYQRRAFNVLLFWAMPDMPKTTQHEIGLDELAWGMGLERASQRMERLVDNLDKMMEARVVWNLLDDKGDIEEWESATLLPYVKVSKRKRTVSYEFTRAFQERVYNPSEFAEIALGMQRVFRSEHALALYENTRRFLAHGETPWIQINTFRTLMGVNDKPYYDEYKYLNARLIKPSIQQVNESSDIQLQLKTKRRSRAIVELKFLISENPQMKLFTESLKQAGMNISLEDKRRLSLRLAGYRIAGRRAEQLIETYSEDEIIAALDAADSWMEAKENRGETIANPAGVAYKAITEGWQVTVEATPTSITQVNQGEKEPQIKEDTAQNKKRRERLHRKFRRSWYLSYIETISSEELELHKEAFRESVSDNKVILDRLQKSGFTGLVLTHFQHFLAARGIEPTEEEFEAYLNTQAHSSAPNT